MRLFSDDADRIPDIYLRRAFVRAENGRGTTSPNPLVGCVIVSPDGEVVGEGHHERAGGPHAEVNALAEAGALAAGSTAYVTLEPCNHHGKTPPCTDSLIAAGVARVVIGMPDPNPTVDGGGAEALEAAGIEVAFADDPAPFVDLNEPWLHWLETGLPWVRVKTALSLDGHPAATSDARTHLTAAAAREMTMRLRSQADAVLIGARTASVDDPSLVVRDTSDTPHARQPLRVVLGRNSVPDVHLFRDGLGDAVALLPSEWAKAAPSGVEVIEYSGDAGVRSAFGALAERGCTSVLVEAGAGLLTALWELRMIDELVLYHAGGMLGDGAQGAYLGKLFSGRELEKRMVAREAAVLGEDAVTVWRPAHEG